MGISSDGRRLGFGLYVFGLAAIATGAVDAIWGAFDPSEQPIHAWGDHIAGERFFAYAVAALLIVGGGAVLQRRSAVFGATLLALAYLIFTVFWFPRFYTAPHYLGLTPTVMIGVFGGALQEIIIVAAAVMVAAAAAPESLRLRRAASVARWAFALSAIDFGLNHLTNTAAVVALVPKWLPPSGAFWAILTGICFVLAGIAIALGIQDVLAAKLLALMLFVFSVLALVPLIHKYPHAEGAWGANIYNIVAVGAALIVADYLAIAKRGYAVARV